MERLTRMLGPKAESAEARVPPGDAVYAVGDIHGRLDLLDAMLKLIAADVVGQQDERRTLVYLGDYVDRGDDAKGVIDRLIEGPPPGFEQICLMGNHEAWMLDFLEDANTGAGWLMNGGGATLASYGARAGVGFGFGKSKLRKAQESLIEALPDDHLTFLQGLRYMWRLGDYAFVHAGIRPGVALDDQTPRDLMWIRSEFLDDVSDFGAMVVHGHTISDAPSVLNNRIGIDTGAFATGQLTCLVLRDADRRFLQT